QLKLIQLQQSDHQATLTALATLLRQTAIAAGIHDAQSINGADWVNVLKQNMDIKTAELIAVSRYKKQERGAMDTAALYAAVEQWIKQHQRKEPTHAI
ncbi:MAG: DUF4381 family protein, partial [Pseudomonadales bacterium]|nr:DUF4381 family protein [Pseudomonadales bacterium]